MAVVTSAVVGVASAGFSIYQSFEQKAKAERKAKEGMEASDKLINEAEILAEKEMLAGVQVPLDAFESEAEQTLQNSKQIIDTLQDGDARSLAAGAGSVAGQNNLIAQEAREDKASLIYENDLMKAEEKQDINSDLKDFKVAKAVDQNLMARDAEEAAAQATKDIVAATGQIITSGASVVSLFPGGKKTQTDKLFDRQERLDARMLRKTTRNKSV
jgi:hypothetical protein|tara:strand:+ start:3621 stop:4265 length:645 start_codon:yes stop_codon:yes gene_type:complete